MAATAINGSEDETFAYALQIADLSAFPMVMHSAIDLGVFEILAGEDRKMTPAEIAVALKAKNTEAPAMLDRMLRLLAAFKVVSAAVEESGERVYGMAPVGKYFVKDEDGVSLGPLMALIQDKVFLDSWTKLKDAVLEGGIPFNMVHGVGAFEYPKKDPRFNEVFNKAMYNVSTITMKKLLEVYKGFDDIKQLVDVGGGIGHALKLIVSKYPSIKGINFDLPHVIKHATAHPGIEHIGGDMFESVPEGDAIFMKYIMHDWSDEHCTKLLKNCYKVLPENGKVIVVDSIVPEVPETTTVAQAISEVDLIMMTQNQGGKERTRKEFQALAKAAGFSRVEFSCNVCRFWVMEFHK